MLSTIVVEDPGRPRIVPVVFRGFAPGDPMVTPVAVFGVVSFGVAARSAQDVVLVLFDPRGEGGTR